MTAIRKSLSLDQVQLFIAVGGDARFAAQQIGQAADAAKPATIGAREFHSFVAECEVQNRRGTLADVPPALRGCRNARAGLAGGIRRLPGTQARNIIVPDVSMCEGLLEDLARSITGQEDSELSLSARFSPCAGHRRKIRRQRGPCVPRCRAVN